MSGRKRMAKDLVRIACGAGSWGDDIGEPRELMSRTDVDYLIMDYLAEVTLSIMRSQLDKDPEKGFAGDVITVLRDILPLMEKAGTRLVTNAGGLNPHSCGRAVAKLMRELGLEDRFKLAVVDGDDLLPELPALAREEAFTSLDDGRPFSAVAGRILSANAYLGAAPIREALDGGADIVITGRCADVSLTVGPLLHEFGWTDWDLIAAGAVAGHLLECGAQSTGGNYHGWQSVPGLEQVGYPIVEVARDGVVVLTKAPGTGGVVNRATATEQLLHEIFDPRAVLTPDATVDWTSIELEDLGQDRVRVFGVKGAPPPPTLKVSMTYADGWRVVLMWPYAWPQAVAKAQATLRKIEATVKRLGLRVDASRADIFGTGAIHGSRIGALDAAPVDPPEVFARYAARTEHRADAQRLSAQQAPMHHGPPGLAGSLAGGRGQVVRIYSHWGTVIAVDRVTARVGFVARDEALNGGAQSQPPAQESASRKERAA